MVSIPDNENNANDDDEEEEEDDDDDYNRNIPHSNSSSIKLPRE